MADEIIYNAAERLRIDKLARDAGNGYAAITGQMYAKDVRILLREIDRLAAKHEGTANTEGEDGGPSLAS